MTERTPFVGIGTGRCGTNSLSKIVNACQKTRVYHEGYQLYWYETNKHLGRMIQDFREGSKNGVLCGDVGQAVGPHIGKLRSSFPDLKVVCLHRDKASTVESFVKFGSYMIRPQDKMKWVDGCMGNDFRANAQKCFPLIDAASIKQSYEFYWDMYEKIMASVTEPVLHMQVAHLNKDVDLAHLFDFLEIPRKHRVYSEKRQFWTSADVEEARRRMSIV